VLSQPQARQDGYTLLLANAANAINAMLYEKLDFNFIRDIAPVAASEASPLSSQSIVSGQDRSRTHRLCQSQSG
jgi:Tripartite tricarboxylate transporter family receptor